MAIVHIALGSNIEPQENLAAAARMLREHVRVVAQSPVYRTAPWGHPDQQDFLNAVIRAETGLAPEELLDVLLEIESRRERERTIPNAPRTLDLDLLFYDEQVLHTPRLQLPHPRLHERGFVLAPLADVAPDLRHPLLGKTVAEMKSAVTLDGIVATAFTLPDPGS